MRATVYERLKLLAHAAVDMRKSLDRGVQWYEESDVTGLRNVLLNIRVPTALNYSRITPQQADEIRGILAGALPKVG